MYLRGFFKLEAYIFLPFVDDKRCKKKKKTGMHIQSFKIIPLNRLSTEIRIRKGLQN